MKSLAVATLVVALTTGCAGGGEATPEPTSATSAAVTSVVTESSTTPTVTTPTEVTTTAVPTTTTSPSIPAPTTTPTTTSDVPLTTIDPGVLIDWFAIVDQLLERRWQLPQVPTLEGVAELCLPDSGCETEMLGTVTFLVENGFHIEGFDRPRLDSVEFLGTVDDIPLDEALLVSLAVVQTNEATIEPVLVDESGNVVDAVTADDVTAPGIAFNRTVVVGRESVGSPWKLVDTVETQA